MADGAHKSVTLNDVARDSGVSYQTVSRVVNAHPHVSKATRERVLTSIEALNYRPNRVARSLATRSSGTLGIISFGTTYYGPAQTFANIERAVRANGYGLTFYSIDKLTKEGLQKAVENLSSHQVDGIVMGAPFIGLDPTGVMELCGNIPVVMIDVPKDAPVPSVVIDQVAGSRLATQHLVDLGHKDVAEVSGPLSWHDATLRHEAWLATLRAASLTPGPSAEGDWSAAGGYRATERLLRTGRRFSALVAANDQTALGAARALRAHNLRIPEDVSIVGFDNIPEAAFFEPPLTTVSQDFTALGQQSVDYLLALIGDPKTPLHQRVLYPTLVERQSVKRREAEDKTCR